MATVTRCHHTPRKDRCGVEAIGVVDPQAYVVCVQCAVCVSVGGCHGLCGVVPTSALVIVMCKLRRDTASTQCCLAFKVQDVGSVRWWECGCGCGHTDAAGTRSGSDVTHERTLDPSTPNPSLSFLCILCHTRGGKQELHITHSPSSLATAVAHTRA